MLTISGIRDVTERKRAEDALRARASLTGRLLTLGDTLNRPFTVPQVVEAIGRAALSLSEADRAAVYVCQPNGTVTCPWLHGLSSEYVAQMLAHLR